MGQWADEQLGSSDRGALVDTKLNTSPQSVLAAKAAISTLGCIRKRVNESVDPSSTVNHGEIHLELSICCWTPQHKKDGILLE